MWLYIDATNNHMKNKKVILVEDNLADVELVKITLREIPYAVDLVSCNDGQALLNYLHSAALRDIALVLLDLNMPRVGGIEVLRTMHQDPQLRQVPVVVFTTSANRSDILRCYEWGAKAYVCKPLDLMDFNLIIRSTVEFWTTVNVLPSYA